MFDSLLRFLHILWHRGQQQMVMYSMLIIGLYFFWDPMWLWGSLIAFIIISMFGGEIGLHRYFCHKTFTCSKGVERFLLVCSILCGSGPTIVWVGLHRTHHRHADTDEDPHSPKRTPLLNYLHLNEIKNLDLVNYAPDLLKDPVHMWVHSNYNKIYLFTLIIAALISPYICLYLLVIPAILHTHMLGLVVTPNHIYGYQNFKNKAHDESRNNPLIALLTFGAGWHNNHHNNQGSYTTKVKPWEFDISGWVIKHLLAKEVKQ